MATAYAYIGPTGYDSFGIIWRGDILKHMVGDYSGPFHTFEDATERAEDIAEYFDESIEITLVENVNNYQEITLKYLRRTVLAATGE